MGFEIAPPRAPIADKGGFITPEWFRFLVQVQRMTGSGLIEELQSAEYLTYTPAAALSNSKTLLGGTALTLVPSATDVTIDLDDTAVTVGAYGGAAFVPSFTVDQQGRLTAASQIALNTDNITEGGTNLYFTTARARVSVSAGTGLSYNSGTGVFSLDTGSTRNVDHATIVLTAGAGLTGGGDITASRTLDVGAGTGITVNANDVALDTTSTRNTDHAGVTLTAGAGLTGGGDISASRSFAVGAGTGITVNADDVALDTASNRNTDHSAVSITAGAGLTGGGDLTATRTLNIGAGTGITVNADDIALTVQTAYGTYTPTLTSVANVDTSTAYPCQYMRVGNVVTVSGRLDIDCTAAGTFTQLGISLPIASNLANDYQCGGTASTISVASMCGGIRGDAVNDRAELSLVATVTSAQGMFFSFTYQVI